MFDFVYEPHKAHKITKEINYLFFCVFCGSINFGFKHSRFKTQDLRLFKLQQFPEYAGAPGN